MSGTTNGGAPAFGGFAHCEIAVDNADRAAVWIRDRLGLEEVGYAAMTPARDEWSYVLGQGRVTLMVTGAVAPGAPAADFVRAHGEGVRDVGLVVTDPQAALREAVRRGAIPVEGRPAIDVMGAYTYTFVAASATPAANGSDTPDSFLSIDHLACALGHDELDRWADFHVDVLGFEVLMKEVTDTGRTSMRSIVVRDADSGATLTFVAPGDPGDRSQISEFLARNGGPGVQHIALSTRDICGAVDRLTEAGVEFLDTPGAYYDALARRVPALTDEVEQLRARSILADQDEGGELLQIFTQPMTGRPTLFLEVIERRGRSSGFGAGNIKALFQAVETEQLRRGTM